MTKGACIIMAKTIICQINLTGALQSVLYLQKDGQITHREYINVIDIGPRIADICEETEINNVILFGPASHLSKLKYNILSRRPNFAFNDTKVLINPNNLEEDYV